MCMIPRKMESNEANSLRKVMQSTLLKKGRLPLKAGVVAKANSNRNSSPPSTTLCSSIQLWSIPQLHERISSRSFHNGKWYSSSFRCQGMSFYIPTLMARSPDTPKWNEGTGWDSRTLHLRRRRLAITMLAACKDIAHQLREQLKNAQRGAP